MIQFKEIRLSDKPVIDKYLRAGGITSCDYTFVNIYSWQHAYCSAWAEVEGMLVVRSDLGLEGDCGYMLAGCGDYNKVIPAIMNDAGRRGRCFRMIALDNGSLKLFGEWAEKHYGIDADGEVVVGDNSGCVRRGMECFAVCDNRNYQDYIYSADDLVNLPGRKFHPKRNHVNKFETTYKDRYEYRELRADDLEECLQLELQWQQRKESAEQNSVEHRAEHEAEMSEEQRAIRRVFEGFDAIGIFGGILRVDGHVVAFTYGSELTPEVFCTHIEKADASYDGVFPMINICFARELAARGYKLVNREEDMGLVGLRRSKLSYNPVAMQEKMAMQALSEREIESRELWQRVFGDTREFVDLFMTEVYKPENMLVHCEQNRVVAMLHLVEISTQYGPTGYLYAVATDPKWRGYGFASMLINRAVEVARTRGYKAIMLIPSEESLKKFYGRLGFEDRELQLDFSEGFDLGTGVPEHDLAMVREL